MGSLYVDECVANSQDTGSECRYVMVSVPGVCDLCGGSHAGVGFLHAERCDEDVHHHHDEDEGRGDVFQNVQLVVLAFIVQIPLH